jgi:outer membrane protein assembly factor BamB
MEEGFYEAFDIRTGNVAWKSEIMEYPWGSDSFGAYAYQSAYGLLYRQSYDGVYAFNWTNGKIVWKYTDYTVPYETPYTDENGLPVNAFNAGGMVADGKLYTYNTEHTPTYPRTRGWKIHCINATSGEGLWTMMGSQTPAAVADGYLVTSNPDDGYMYVYGKGKSAATVSAPQTSIPLGESIVLTGTVLDQSPAQPNAPCVSKESMTLQMQYLHMQMPIGGLWGNETMTGVPVSLDTLDPNGNYVHIGDVTTDGYSGTFGFTWEPEVPGQYQVTATFMGDDSYGSSFATTYVNIAEAAATVTPMPFEKAPDYTGLLYALLAVGIIAILLILVLLFRKKQ